MLYVVGVISCISPHWRNVLESCSSLCYNSHWVFFSTMFKKDAVCL